MQYQYDHPTQQSNPKGEKISVSTLRGLITIVLVLGVIAGGTAGALVTTLIQSDGIPSGVDQDLSFARAKTVLVEESNVISTVESSSSAVVSIIIEKKPSKATGNMMSPFGLDFQIPGFEIIPPSVPDGNRGGDVEKQEDEDELVQVGAGTGFVVSENGLILTNKHVVNDEEASYRVVTKSGDSYEVEILGIDPVYDLALVKTKEDVKIAEPLQLGDSDTIQIGQQVIAIGNSLGEFSHTVTTGIVSGVNRRVTAGDGAGFSEVLEAVIQTDAAINPGNSGGPLLNSTGQVIGVNTAVSQQGQLIGFAIPINDAIRLIEGIQKHGRVIRPYLGVRYILINEAIQKANNLDVDYGALLRRGDDPTQLAVVPGGPADKAGLEENDIVLEVNGQKIDESHSLVRVLSEFVPGDTVKLKVLKDGNEVELSLTLGEFGDDNS